METLLSKWLGIRTAYITWLIQSVAIVLTLFFFLQYPAQVFAQSEGTSTPEPEAAPAVSESEAAVETEPVPVSSKVTEPASEETEIQSEEEEGLSEPESQSMMAGQTSGGNMTSIDDRSQKGVNALTVDENSGAMVYSYPITIPNGRGGATPNLSLNYSNQSASDNDIFGYGWSLSLPYIEVLNKEGVNKLYSTSSTAYFYSSLSGELVRIGSTTAYRAKVETGDFLQYASTTSGWEVLDKSGIKYYFGTASTSRQSSSTDASKVSRWFLSKVEDTNGNYATYTYTKNLGAIYPATISYSHSSTTTGMFEVRFTLATSTLGFKSFDKAFTVTRAYKVSEIGVYVSNSKVRNYALRYGAGLNGKRDVLAGITESGIEGSSTTTLPEMTFGYEGVQKPTWTNGQYINNFPEPLSEKDLGVRFGDLNADGLTDVVRYYQVINYSSTPTTSVTVKRVHINRGDGHWDYNVSWNWDDIAVPFQITETNITNGATTMYNDMGTRLVDVNGDGKDDLVVAYNGPVSYTGNETVLPPKQMNVYLNTGNGFKKDTTWTGLVNFSEWNTSQTLISNSASGFVDVNGDGLPDIVTSYFASTTLGSPQANTSSTVLINSGNGWAYDSSYVFPAALGRKADANNYRTFDDNGTRLADVNGDGLVDILRGYRDSGSANVQIDEKNVYLNTGKGWATSSTWTLPSEFFYNGKSTGVNIVDINGDRLPDLILSHDDGSSGVFDFRLNVGDSWSYVSYNLPFFLTQTSNYQNLGLAFIDFDGDTLVDLWGMNYADQVGTHATGGTAVLNNNPIPDQLTSIVFPQGGAIDVTLDGYIDTTADIYTNVGSSTINPVVVSDYSYSSGFGNEWSNSYDYANAGYYYATSSFRDRKFSGFGKVVRTDSLSKVTTYFHQGNGNATTSQEANDNVAKMGFVYRSDINDLQNNLYQVKVNTYSTTSLGNTADFVKLDRETRLDYDGDSGHRDVATEYSYNSATGTVSQLTEWGRVTADTDGTFSDVSGDKRVHTYAYAASAPYNVSALPARETVKNESNATTSEVRYYYDSQSLGSVTKGNLTKQEYWVATSSYIDREWLYNGYGLVYQEKDPRDKTTTYVYETNNLYPATTTNPLSQSTRYTYDYSAGKPKTVIDPNNLTQTFVYDGLDRITQEQVPDSLTSASTTKTMYTYYDGSGTSSVRTQSYRSNASSTDTYSYLDGFGRQIQSRSSAETSGQYVVRDFKYGDNGLLRQESLPYFGTSSPRIHPTYLAPLYTTYTYDPQDRISAIKTSVGTTSTSYNQWGQTFTDALGKAKDFTYDAYGRLTAVGEHNGTSTYTTTYEWDNNNNLTKITDALGNIRNITYDGLSHRLTLQDLHDPSDASFGTWSFAYDPSGNLTTKTDPKSQVVGYTYDDVNRTLTENYTGTAGTEVTNVYDSCTLGVGRLCTAGNTSATTTFTYNYAGLPATTTRTIGTTTYSTKQTYDRLGNQTLLTYPDNSEVAYTYNNANLIETVKQRESGGSWQNIITNFDYGPHGLVTYQEHGNGTKTTKTYDPFELYRLRTILTTASSTYGTGGAGEEQALIEAELFSLGLLDEVGSTTSEEEIVEPSDTPEEVIPQEEVLGVATTTEEQATSTATSTPEIDDTVSATSSTSTSIEFGLASTTSSTSTLLTDSLQEVAVTTAEIASTTEIKPVDTALTDHLIKNSHEARMWQEYHAERVAALEQEKDLPPEILESAKYAKDKFDNYLLQKGYITEKDAPVKGQARDVIERGIKKTLETIVSAILPAQAYAYIFGAEDFEDCTSLPCSFNNTSTWGSVTQSLDATSKVQGTDSLKELVTGEGSALLESINHNEDEIYAQFKVFIPSTMTWGASNYYSILRFEDSSDGTIFWVTVENWSGTPRLVYDGDTLPWTNTGLNLTKGAVNTIEVRFKKSATVGDVDIWLNTSTEGSPSYNGSGSLNTGTDNVDDVQVGITYAPENGIATTYYDDTAIDTAFIGTLVSDPVEPFDAVLQDLTYIYDAAGNITHVLDESNASSTVAYEYRYDDLYRLTAFGTTTASITSDETIFPIELSLQPGSEGKDTYYGTDAEIGGLPNSDSVLIGGYSDYYYAFFEFDLADFSDIGDVAAARIKLYTPPNAHTNPNNAKFQRVTSSWTEMGITKASHPSASDFGMPYQAVPGNDWWIADITNLADDWLDGTYANYGVELMGEGNQNQVKGFFTSDHATPAYRPILEIEGSMPYDRWHVSTSSSFTPIETYTYDALGNLLTKSDVGAYSYDGDTGNEVTSAIYTDSITSGWSDWSWSTTLNPSNSSPVRVGSYSLRATYTSAWGGMSYHSASFNSSPYSSLHLSVNVGTSTAANLYAYFTNSGGTALHVVDLEDYVTGDFAANTWYDIDIPLADLSFTNYNNATNFTIEGSAAGTVYYDDIRLVGTTGTPNYANPHAPTTINGVSYAYDTNGNLTSAGSVSNTWNYDNRMTATHDSATTTYTYDQAGQRVSKTVGTLTTRYPSNFYEVVGTTTTKHIYAGDALIATVQSDTPGPKTYHNHLDHLGSTAAVTTDIGYLNKELAYYPFGGTRVDEQYGPLNQSNQFIGQNFDEESSLSYLNARYYDANRGQMLSQDPVFIGMGVDSRTAVLLKDPQLQNSYGYARNNPLIFKDPNGDLILLALPPLAAVLDLVGMGLLANNVIDATADAYSYYQTHFSPYTNGYSTDEKLASEFAVTYDIYSFMAVSKYKDETRGVADATFTALDSVFSNMIETNAKNRRNKSNVQNVIDQNTRNTPVQQSTVSQSSSASTNSSRSSSSRSGSSPTKAQLKSFEQQINQAKRDVEKLERQIKGK